ncbi:hypothetical protein DB30_05748 [Enhygromyxa salina]|uniref:Uncharacterized protein n=1 Tax=Enhygromyxa salina TaxID=215803 RepID=A0A0C2CWA2_9BACT|nr:hypothetical protein DB30_05748 [Enhygromyxa salina]
MRPAWRLGQLPLGRRSWVVAGGWPGLADIGWARSVGAADRLGT